MLMLYDAPNFKGIIEYCKANFEIKYDLKIIPLKKYLSFESARLTYPYPDKLWNHLVDTKKIYGFQVNESDIYIHPDRIVEANVEFCKKIITKNLSDTDSILLN